MVFGIFRLTKYNSNWESAGAANKSTHRHSRWFFGGVACSLVYAHPNQEGLERGIYIRQSIRLTNFLSSISNNNPPEKEFFFVFFRPD
jgi:hypothetical protein